MRLMRVLVCWTAIMCGGPMSARADEAADLQRNIEQAYRSLQSFETRQELLICDPKTGEEKSGGWRRHFVYDRREASFRLEDWYGDTQAPTVTTVCNGQKLWQVDLRSVPSVSDTAGKGNRLPDRVMEVTIGRPRDFYSLVAQDALLRGDWPLTLALPMGRSMTEEMQRVFAQPDALHLERVPPRPDDPDKLIGLRVSGLGKSGLFSAMVFRVDPQRFWIRKIEIEDGAGKVARVLKTSSFAAVSKMSADTFQYKTRGLTIVHSPNDLVQQTGVTVPVSMLGKPAPAVRPQTLTGAAYDLSKDPSPVVVLAFAKWDRFQIQSQSWLPRFHKWIRNNAKRVSLYAVASGQSPESVKRSWAEMGLSIPVLLDKAESVKQAYNVGLSRVFVISGGKIVDEDNADFSQIVAIIESLLAENPGPAEHASAEGMVGQPAPPIRLKTLSGVDCDLAADRSNVIIVDFMTTWCGPCRDALPVWQKLSEWAKQTGKPIFIYAIDCGQTEEVVQKLWQQLRLSIPALMDKDNRIADAFHVTTLPRSYMIHRGTIVHTYTGLDVERVRSDALVLLR